MSARELPEARDDQDRQILGWVADYGWAVLGIAEDGEGPPCTFSVGLWRGWQHPEVVIFGLSHQASQRLINDLGIAIKAGQTFDPNREYTEIVKGYPIVFVPVHPDWVKDLFGHACWFNRGSDFPVLQCVWPDRESRFPWQEGCDPAFYTRQPVFDAPAEVLP